MEIPVPLLFGCVSFLFLTGPGIRGAEGGEGLRLLRVSLGARVVVRCAFGGGCARDCVTVSTVSLFYGQVQTGVCHAWPIAISAEPALDRR